MGTPNVSGATDTMSGGAGANTMGYSGSKSKKQTRRKGRWTARIPVVKKTY
jgi:hypothetical protein